MTDLLVITGACLAAYLYGVYVGSEHSTALRRLLRQRVVLSRLPDGTPWATMSMVAWLTLCVGLPIGMVGSLALLAVAR